MTEYIDSFGRKTILEVMASTFNNKVCFIVRKERQAVYEALEIEAARELMLNLQQAIQIIEEKNVSK
mgnify:CR=1 FL=1